MGRPPRPRRRACGDEGLRRCKARQCRPHRPTDKGACGYQFSRKLSRNRMDANAFKPKNAVRSIVAELLWKCATDYEVTTRCHFYHLRPCACAADGRGDRQPVARTAGMRACCRAPMDSDKSGEIQRERGLARTA